MKTITTFLFILLSLTISVGVVTNQFTFEETSPNDVTTLNDIETKTIDVSDFSDILRIKSIEYDEENKTTESVVTSKLGFNRSNTGNERIAVANCVGDFTLQLDASGNASILAVDLNAGSTGGNLSFSASRTSFTCADIGDVIVTLTVSDSSDTSVDTCTVTITIEDNIDPVTPTLTTVSGQCSATATAPTTTDTCFGTVTGTTSDPLSYTSQGTYTIVWNFDDGNGNDINVNQTVLVDDTQDPTAANPADINVQCFSDVPAIDIAVVIDEADNCSGPITVAFVSDVSDGNFNPETITRTYSVTDASSNSINVTQIITVQDTIDPVANCIGGTTTIQLDGSGNGSILTTDVDNGSSDNCGPLDLSFAGVSPDLSNNIALNKPASQSSNYNAGNSYPASKGVDGNFGNFTHTRSSNNIGQWWEVNLQANFDIGLIRLYNRSSCCQNRLNDYRITLFAGATVVATQDFITQPALSLDITSLVGAADRIRVTQLKNAPLSIGEFEVYPAGGGMLEFDCSDLGQQNVTMIATDASGNSSSCNHSVNVVDTIDPTIICASNVTVNVDATGCFATGVNLGPLPSTNDNCATLAPTNNAPASFPVGVTNVIWTVEDTSGNTAICIQTVTVIDNVDPVITCPTNIIQDTDLGQCTAVVTFSPPTATDCSGFTITQIDSTGLISGSTFPIGTTTLEYQVLDDGNLLATCSFTIVIEDNEDPTITAPINIAISTDLDSCGASIAILNAGVGDNCTSTTITWAMTGATVLTGSGQVGTQSFNIGTTTIIYTVEDAAGNTQTDSMTVAVSDNQFPTITAPGDITISAGVNCEITSLSLGAPSTSDNCGVASVSNDASPPYLVGTTTVIWTVIDAAGNTTTATQDIIVEDDIAPTLTLPSTVINVNTSVEGDYNCSMDVIISAVAANDNCSGSILTWEMTGTTNNGGTGTGQVPSPYPFNLGVTTIAYLVTDTSIPANTISRTLTITVFDDEDPTISALSDVSVSNDTGVCGASVTWTEPAANDNCSVANFVQTTGFSNPFTFPIGTTTVTYEAEDGSGNSITSSFDVTVIDDEVPTIFHPNQSANLAITTSDDGVGNCTVSIPILDAIINDNCTVSELSWIIVGDTTGSGLNQVGTRIFNIGTSVITYTLSDNNSPALQATVSITIVVTDDEAPTFNLPSNITVNSCNTVVNYNVTGSDNCGVASITQIDSTGLTSGDSFPSGTTTLEYEITDVNGLTFSDTFTITVIDDVLPIVNCPSNVSINNDSGLCTANYDYQVIATDDCSASPTLDWDMTGAITDSGTGQIGNYPFPVGVTTVTFTVSDGVNNDTCTSTVTVADNESPVITCPIPVASYDTDADSCTARLDFAATATDNCDSPTLVYSIGGTPISFSYDFQIGTTAVDVTANTTNGLTDNCSFNVIVEDNQDPVISCPTVASSYSTDAGLCTASLSLPATATDNSCSGSPIIIYAISGTPIVFPYDFPTGSTIVTATTNDGNGQTDTCDYTVVVEDNENPIANCLGSLDITLDASGSASIVAGDLNNLSSDNCGIQNVTLDIFDFDCSDLGSNTITLTVFDTSGNSSTCTTTVTVLDPASNSGVEINVDNNPICKDGDIEFTATPLNGGASPVYEWFINGVSQGTNSPTFVPFTSLNDGDDVYVQMQSSVTSCNTPVQSVSIFVTVFPTPIVTAPAELCLGSSANLTPSSGGTWMSSNSAIATINNSGLVSAVSAGTVEFTFTSATGGCERTTNPVLVNSLPVLTTPATICVDATDVLLPSSGGTWTSNNATIATIDNTGTVTGVSVGFATFTFVDANGCLNTTGPVEVLESPVIDTLSVSTNPLCSGETVTMQATLQPLSNPSSQVTLINYNFNLGDDTLGYSDYDGQEIPGIVSGMNSSTMIYNYGYNGTNTGGNAFVADPTTGDENSLRQRDDAGFNDDGEWIFNIGGSVLDDYRDFRVYFQTRRNNVSGNPKYIDISYRANGTGPFVNILRYDLLNNGTSTVWREVLFALPPAADNVDDLEIKLYVNDGGNSNGQRPDVRIDNFQLQGSIGGDIVSYSWTADTGAAAGLPASASVPSSGNSIIQVNPIVSTNYTLTVQNSGNGCVDIETVSVAVSASPEVFVTAEYCPVDDPATTGIDESELVQLVASSSSDPNINYEWQTNPIQTGAVIYTDVANIFTVVATNAIGCSTVETISIAEELVIDGDFTNLDVLDNSAYPFTSQQIFVPNQPGLVPAGQGELWADGGLLGYTITVEGNDTHAGFHGSDHTDNTVGPQQFMAVNGDGGAAFGNQIDVWRQSNTPVLPNTTYYFSAWAMRLVNGSPPRLRFKINGTLVGTQLTPPPRTGNGPGGDNWERFYGTYTTGPAETAVDIFIVNTNGSAGGNDFGIDDISFATLSTFIRLDTDPSATSQTVCQDTPIAIISYDIGGGLTPPTIEWTKNGASLGTGVFPDGLSFVYNGSNYSISGAPTEFGVYEFTLETTSACDVKTADGTITVEEAPAAIINNTIDLICFGDSSVLMDLSLSGSATSGTWSTTGSGSFSGDTYNFGATETGILTLTFISNTPSGSCDPAIATYDLEITPYVVAEAGTVPTVTDCDETTINLLANNVLGTWTVTSGQPINSYSFSDASVYNSSFTGESGETYTLQWEATNVAPCANTLDTVVIAFPNCGNNIDFDGIDDYISFGDNYNMNSGAFSLEAWVKIDDVSGSKTIISKRDGNALTSGYDLMVFNGRLRFRWNNNGQVISTQQMNRPKWYHVAVTFDGSNNYNLYIDGFNLGTNTSGVSPTINSNRFVVGATDRTSMSPSNFFGGAIDEVRVWNSSLTQTQIHQMMNQELALSGADDVIGVVVPRAINGLQWSNLMGYYQMTVGPQTSITNGNISDISTVIPNEGKLNAMNTVQVETAPIPYISASNTDWDLQNTWVNGVDQQIPNSTVNSINAAAQTWNIVRTQHDVSTNRPTSVLGLLVDSNELSVINNQPLTVNGYLNIDAAAVLDLEGESQLLQTMGSIVGTGTGKVERDQQGTTNLYNYNYWTSPVATSASTFRLDDVLYDGFNVNNPQAVGWTDNQNSIGTSNPVTLSRRWLYSYRDFPESSYSSWQQLSETTNVDVGLGFAMKGSGASGSDQNYTFIGRPNNGTITATVSGGYQALIGNPYPSAIDGNTFILDNPSALQTGAINLWEHAASNNSHVLSEYEGGYAILNLSGGLPATTPPSEIGGLGNVNKTPGRYIPIGQGFFVTGDSDGGTIIFQNSQRTFRRESAASVFFRTYEGVEEIEDDTSNGDRIKRIRLDFTIPENAVRHTLLAFVENSNATDGIDYGYDAPNNDAFSSDMSYGIEGERFVIQGVKTFDITKMYPLIVTLANSGTVEVALNEFENFDEDVDLFIYDSLLGTYTQFNDLSYQITLSAGNYYDRFFLAFQEDQTLSTLDAEFNDIQVDYLHNTDEIYIKTANSIQVKQIYLINITGQTVGSWNATNQPLSNEIRIPVQRISEGNYILKVETNYRTYNKKIIIKY